MVTRLAIGKNSFPCLEIIFHRMNGTLYCQVTILYRYFSLEINYNVIVCCGFQGKRGIVKPPFELPEFIKKTGIMEMREAMQEKVITWH